MREGQRGTRTGSDLERRYPVALVLYVALAVLAWFTIGEGSVMVGNTRVEVRWVAMFILGLLVFRTVMAIQADRIRRGGSE